MNTAAQTRSWRSQKATWGDVLIAAALLSASLLVLFPIYNLLVISLTTEVAVIRTPVILFPAPFSLDSYWAVFRNPLVMNGILVTFLIMAVGVPYSLFLSTSMAFGLTKNIPGMKLAAILLIVTLYFSGGLIPYYLLMKKLGLINNVLAMILPYGASVFDIIILRNFFLSIPKEMEESATMDGAGDIMVYARILLPMSTPILVTIGLFIAVAYWNEWWNCLLFISDSRKQSLQYVLRSILMEVNQLQAVGDDTTGRILYSEGIKSAVVLVTALPVVILYPFLQKYFVRGLSSGALKF